MLPGAFSAYCYITLQNDIQGKGPLQKYFLGEKMFWIHIEIFYQFFNLILAWFTLTTASLLVFKGVAELVAKKGRLLGVSDFFHQHNLREHRCFAPREIWALCRRVAHLPVFVYRYSLLFRALMTSFKQQDPTARTTQMALFPPHISLLSGRYTAFNICSYNTWPVPIV
ncbi:hypothetical protein B0H16DRAFT_1487244 [Mycena metata]|uniref:Chitin synthase n=1 Tax=Mycena metata TaxID=1033252 RepID=A0AAD7GID4_9AGAR|nr:hypothetical protein B0H16DRAFT_1487244 [Mycena metata]